MKWGGITEKISKKITERLSSRGLYILISVASFILLLGATTGATSKWGG